MSKRLFTLSIFIIFCLLSGEEMMATGNQISLPKPAVKGKVSLEETISKRRSVRSFSAKDLNLEQISQLLWSAQGITAEQGTFNFRAAPSAGALYPMEIYALTKDGFFHYLPEANELDVLGNKDLRKNLNNAAFGQGAVATAPLDIVICAVYERVTAKYGERGVQYVHIEAGHVAQNIHLQAVSLGLGSVPIGAFADDAVSKILSLPSDCRPLYIIPVGYPG